MTQLHIHLFGEMQAIQSDGQTLRLPPSTQSLFAYLILFHGRSHSRELLTSLFWEDLPFKNARRCLSTTLWRLRKGLPDGIDCLAISETGNVRFARSDSQWIDILSFEEKAHHGLRLSLGEMDAADATVLEEAISLYRGNLLDGYYDEWVLQERERLHLLYLRTLSRLMRYYGERNELSKGILHGQRLLTVDPLREQIHRDLMRLYMKKGERSLAIQQYETCRHVLVNELGIAPMPETQALHKQLISQRQLIRNSMVSTSSNMAVPVINGRSDKQGIALALQQIEQAMAGLEQARAYLRSLQ